EIGDALKGLSGAFGNLGGGMPGFNTGGDGGGNGNGGNGHGSIPAPAVERREEPPVS
ncbi:SPFH/Band 7/PHB domain protein, partial [Streptomyces sp. SID7499]|nr:SPFH/Band 7/PHB domain protein [Streptomyces sp. SID7499]